MKYNKRNIKPFKGHMIQIEYINKINKINVLTGEITANTSELIIFKVNKDKSEITMHYSQIKNISNPEKA